MPGKILGIDINDNVVTAVQVEGGLRGYSIKGFTRVVIEETGDLDGALTALSKQMDLTADTSVSTIPEEQVSYRNLQLPFSDIKKIRQAIAFTIETMVPFPIEDLLVDFTVIDQSDQSEIFAVSVRREDIGVYLTHLQNHGIDPTVLDIRCVPIVLCLLRQEGIPNDGLFIEIGLTKGTMVLYQKKRISLMRTFPLRNGRLTQGVSEVPDATVGESQAERHRESRVRLLCTDIQSTLHSFETQNKRIIEPEKVYIAGSGSVYPETESLVAECFDIPVKRINLTEDAGVQIDEDLAHEWNPALMDNALASALRDTKQGLGFNLRKDEFEIKKKHFRLTKDLRRVAVILIIVLSLLFADLAVDFYFLKRRYRMLDKQITEIFKETLPQEPRVVDPVQQLRVKINEIKKPAVALPGVNEGQKVIDLMRDISEGVPGPLDVKLTRMVVDPEAVLISGETDSFNTVDSIKKGLEPSKYWSAVTISSANLDRSGKRVKFEVKLKRVK